eukprot:403344372
MKQSSETPLKGAELPPKQSILNQQKPPQPPQQKRRLFVCCASQNKPNKPGIQKDREVANETPIQKRQFESVKDQKENSEIMIGADHKNSQKSLLNNVGAEKEPVGFNRNSGPRQLIHKKSSSMSQNGSQINLNGQNQLQGGSLREQEGQNLIKQNHYSVNEKKSERKLQEQDANLRQSLRNNQNQQQRKGQSLASEDIFLQIDEIECDIDEDVDNEHEHNKRLTDRNVNNSNFVNKLKDFSSFNPSGNKGKEKFNQSVPPNIMPRSMLHQDQMIPQSSKQVGKLELNLKLMNQEQIELPKLSSRSLAKNQLVGSFIEPNQSRGSVLAQQSALENIGAKQNSMVNLNKNGSPMRHQEESKVLISGINSNSQTNQSINTRQNSPLVQRRQSRPQDVSHDSQTNISSLNAFDKAGASTATTNQPNQQMFSSSQTLRNIENIYLKNQKEGGITTPRNDSGVVIGTDPSIQIQFFMSLLNEKEEVLREQNNRMKQMRHKVKQQAHKCNKMQIRLRETHHDNLDIQEYMQTVLAQKILQGNSIK